MVRLIALAAPAALILALGVGTPVLGTPVLAAGSEPPPAPPAAQDKSDVQKQPSQKKKRGQQSSDWRDGYRVAVSSIQGGRYEDGLRALAALDRDNSPDVQNYLGYANRKLGRMEEARRHYEAALAIDPDHRGALEYYGEWHVDMNRLDEARGYLRRLATVCGTTCQEYEDLAEAIAQRATQ
ncbi:tetratricopeptide repeat protein [Chelatococcus sp. SYSU_G07232]|uniref:Tetratricopeptide repeat protein n=1 Tax=Chelatococcus albus TaxID=3047466 RepID=A0ABT7AJ07_9HYPH|nr:tetratricopeptide repeat protein [Chelatococcus sp. SYSU_G07232]MDJ1159366.1 tetratricopeptide repeat protein [Chelatococcus sp. SYSU_G07232]